MISFDYQNLLKIGQKHGIAEKDFLRFSESLEKFSKKGLGFYEILEDKKTLQKISAFAKKMRNKFSHIVVLGIGGSALGSIFLQQSFGHLYRQPKLYVIDNIDPEMITEIEEVIDYKKTLFIVITKSGGTPETLAQYLYFRKKCESKKLNIQSHFVFITDPKVGLLRKIANKEKFVTFEVPENVGGRFSVLTPVGLLPAALLGIDIFKLIQGARKADKNISYRLALIQYFLAEKGKNISVMMPYSQKLFRLADWYRQLLAESIGKKFDNNGKEIFAGITPVNALGVTDQHSQSQLYNEGPNDKLIIFIEAEKFAKEVKIPNPEKDQKEIAFLKNTTFNKLISIEKKATENSLTKNSRPNITIKIDRISEENIGELIMIFETSIAFLGKLYNINPYDQPGVELSKILTKEMLLKKF